MAALKFIVGAADGRNRFERRGEKMKTNPEEADRVRRHTSPESLRDIEKKIEENVRFQAGRSDGELTGRLAELENEWSMERTLETNASILALTGAVLGITMSRKWLLLSA